MRERFFRWSILAAMLCVLGCKKQESVELACGGLLNTVCPATMYCQLKEGCGGYDREGLCKPRPMKCPEEREPVCGCNGRSYEGVCNAALSGISVRHGGECDGSEQKVFVGDEEEERAP